MKIYTPTITSFHKGARIIKGNNNITEAKESKNIFLPKDMDLCSTKSLAYFSYTQVLVIHRLNFWEDFPKRKALSRTKGVVGKTGRKIPRTPNPKAMAPSKKQKTRMGPTLGLRTLSFQLR